MNSPAFTNGKNEATVNTSPIAIIGVSGRYPSGANSPSLLWETLKSGRDAVGEAKGDRWDLGWHHPDSHRPGRIYTRAGGFLDKIDEFDADFFGLSPREARQVDPQQRLLLELAWEAHEDAGIAPRSRNGSDTGVFVGISSNDYASLEGAGWPDAYSNTGSSFSIAANRISYIFDFHGPSVAIDTACSSSIVCVHQACASLIAGECSTALAGGVSILTHIRPWLGFARASMLSPTGRCKSFDASGDGYVRAEGGGLVLLKPLADAERDGDRILGVIIASGVNQDGRTMGLSMPNGDAQERLLRKVYSQCGTKADDVFYVEAHGTGTAVGDPIECGALGRVLGAPRENGSECLIGSVKSNIGHLEAASGIAGLTKALLVLKHREIPANLHFVVPNPKIEFENWKLKVVATPTKLPDQDRPIVIGVNSFGFGGTNAHVALQEYRPAARRAFSKNGSSRASSEILILSGHSEAGLKAMARSYLDLLRGQSGHTWHDICAAAATCRTMLRFRLAVAASSTTEAANKIEEYLSEKPVSGLATGRAGTGLAPTAFVYSGNGPQWWAMGRELLDGDKVFRGEIEAIDAIFVPLSGWSLMEEMSLPEAENRIALTEVAQPLLFALQLGLTQSLRAAGIEPSAVLGHSVGEVAAAWASGALSREQATLVIYHRSMEQAKTAGRGRMAALGATPEETIAAMQKIDGWLELAATNAPEAVTVAGDPAALERLVDAMTVAGKFARVLPLNYPFHTMAMESIRGGLVESLSDLAPCSTTVRYVSTVDALEKEGPELSAEYWYRNVREPVRFHDAVTHLLKTCGVAVFMEIGPHPVLKDYVLQSAKACASAAVALPTLRRPGRQGPEPEVANLQTAICAAYAHGGAAPDRLYNKPMPAPELPLYSWQRERHWRGSVLLPDVFMPILRDHSLLGHRVPSADGLWENTADTNQLPYLKDHVVQGAVLFPAAGYIEIALAAAQLTLGKGMLDVENFEIVRPLVIPAHGDPIIQTAVDARDGTIDIRSRQDRDAGEWTTHARGRISRGELRTGTETHDPIAIRQRTPLLVDGAEHYAGANRRGLTYGPDFQGVASVRLSQPDAPVREAFAEINLPSLTSEGLEGYISHPSLLDSCVQVLITLVGQNDKRHCSTIPVQLGRVRSFAPLTGHMYCHVVMQRESARSAMAEFRVMDPSGKLLLTIDAARCQKVEFGLAGPAPLTSEWWRPDSSVPAQTELEPLSPQEDIVAAVKADLPIIERDNDRARFYRDVRPRIDRLVGAYAARAIASLKPGTAPFDIARLARLGSVRRKQTALLAKLVKIAEEDGQLVRAGGSWTWNADRAPESADAIWRELFLEHPRYQAELLLLAHVGDHLDARLHIEDGEALGDARDALFDVLQDTAPFQMTYNQIVRATVERLVATWPKDRPMRVLEIAGGSGGLSAWILPVLGAERTDYLFTDPSDAAIGRAEHRLSAHRFVRFATLEPSLAPSLDWVEQGIPNGYFDLVVGANALAADKGRDELLVKLNDAMAPGGQLILVEPNNDRFAELVLDIQPGAIMDDLRAAGFEETTLLDDGAACLPGQSPQQSVILARRAGVAEATEVDFPVHASESRRLLIVTDSAEASGAFCAELHQLLEARGRCVSVTGLASDDLQSAVAAALEKADADEVIYLAPSAIAGDILATQESRCLSVVRLVQSMETSRREKPCQLTLVTRGAFPTANGQGPVDPGQATVWGVGRVVGNEHSNLAVRMIDLHSALDGQPEARWLAAELLRRDAETEVQLSAGVRYVNRERMTTLVDEARHAGPVPVSPASPAFALDFLPHGGLDSLHLRTLDRKAPESHEVEIAVLGAGLNFRDVLWTMGMLPEEAVEQGFSGPTIGMECAGEIVRVGDAVTALKPGDRVVAFASSCFASHVTTDAGSVVRIPDRLDFASAATIPTAFLTAYYALDYLARLEPGETVLIHGAAGGVGLAAIQIAKLKGAKVIGTAGSPRKRSMLRKLGVDHALNSRSLDFADDVMKVTGGKGVDVVLNSLAGEAITKSLQCLKPFGRFLEIGKRDLYANSRIGLRPFRNNLSYFGIDADTLLIERADLARRIFKQVMEHFATGALKPLPFQEIPISRAAEAFRSMQQSRHVGKLVISTRLDRPQSLPVLPQGHSIKIAGTYLVTGGLGGFGLATAGWLVEQGATSLALIGRRGATTEESIAGIAALEKLGAKVRAFAADISDIESLSGVLATIRAEMSPLVGVIHSAAVIEDAPILNIGPEQLDRVFRPKLLGAWNLHQATLQDPIETFVLYSSSSAVVGNPGQGAYVAANLYLDALAQYRRHQGLPALAVGWGAIKDAGFLTRHEAVAGMLKTRTGLDATPAHEALADLGRLLAVGASRVSVARFDLQRLSQMLPGARVPRFLPIVPKGAAAALQAEETLADLLKKIPSAEHQAFVLARVREHAARVLGTSATQVNVDQPLAEMGLDSLMAVELAGGLGRDLGQPVSVMQMLSAGSLAAIAKVVMKMLGVEDATVATPATSAKSGVALESQPHLQETRA